jgi:hypothetical protein
MFEVVLNRITEKQLVHQLMNFVILHITNNFKTIIKLKFFFFEKHGFHVSSRLADTLGMRASSVRLFFIYLSFVTAGLWFAVYLAFWID